MPSRVVKGSLKYPDHYALLLSLKKIPMRKVNPFLPKKSIIWNTRKSQGWERYFLKTNVNEVLDSVAAVEDADTEVLLKKI